MGGVDRWESSEMSRRDLYATIERPNADVARVRQPQTAAVLTGRQDHIRTVAESSLAPLMQARCPTAVAFERRIEGMRRIGSIAGVAMIKNLHPPSPITPGTQEIGRTYSSSRERFHSQQGSTESK